MLAICTVFAWLTVHALLSTLNTSADTHWSVYKEHCVLLCKIAEDLLFMYNSIDVFSDE